MNILARNKYFFLRAWVRSALRTYYHPITVLHRERLQVEGPFIVVTNHPNTLSDVVLSVVHGYRPIYLLANAGLFRSPQTAWFFRQVYCLPIQRQQDVKRQGISNNVKNMSRVIEHLQTGGAMYIAPEGSSWLEWHLRPLKSGVSRIAFQAAQHMDFNKSLKIIPLGFTYQNGARFRSSVYLEIGASIEVQDWKDQYATDPKGCQKALIQQIEANLQACMVHTDDQFQEILLRQMASLLQSMQPQESSKHYLRIKEILRKIKRWKGQHPAEYQQHLAQSQYLHNLMASQNLQWETIMQKRLSTAEFIRLAATSPLAIWGWLNHLLPWGLPHLINRVFNDDRTFASTYKITAGLLSVPIFYGLQTLLFNWLLPFHWAWGILYLITLAPAGKFAYAHRQSWREWNMSRRFERHQPIVVKAEVQEHVRVLTDQLKAFGFLDKNTSSPLPILLSS